MRPRLSRAGSRAGVCSRREPVKRWAKGGWTSRHHRKLLTSRMVDGTNWSIAGRRPPANPGVFHRAEIMIACLVKLGGSRRHRVGGVGAGTAGTGGGQAVEIAVAGM